MPHLSEVRSADENWSGLQDAGLRRKLQNRLNQRLYRRRRQANPSANTAGTGTSPSASERSQRPAATEQECRDVPARWERIGAELTIQPSKSIHQMSRTEVLQIMAQYEAVARKDYFLGSPRVDQLLNLIQFNVFRALIDNTSVLRFTMDWLDEDAISPWYAGVSGSQIHCCPPSLRPTPLQLVVSHHPWIDLFPIPRMRDNLLQNYGDFDETAICNDLVDFHDVTNNETGLIVWSTSYHPSGWEVSETFLRKWSWVVQGCDELARSTNYWRGLRGEEPLEFAI